MSDKNRILSWVQPYQGYVYKIVKYIISLKSLKNNLK